MSTPFRFLGPLLAVLLVGCAAGSDDYDGPQTPPAPPPAPAAEPVPAPEPYGDPAGQAPSDAPTPPPAPNGPPPAAPAPPAAQAPPVADGAGPYVYTYPSGQWVYTAGRGWVWIPAGAAAVEMEGVPYTYLYTPSYGWTWYVSPWGWGPYRYGGWYRHPWHPAGWHGRWVAHPGVVVRLGPGAHYRSRGHR